MSQESDHIAPGDTVWYRLSASDLPVNPDKRWKGRVKEIRPARGRHAASVVVVSLEPGYLDTEETILVGQIVQVEKPGEA